MTDDISRARPEIQQLLDLPAIAGREEQFLRFDGSAEQAAAIAADLRAVPVVPVTNFTGVETWELTLGERGTAARGYRPYGVDGPLPVLVYFHGGGWVHGSVDAHDAPCRAIATAGRCLVVSVDYGLAPEHPFPEPVEECYDVTSWVAAKAGDLGGDPERILVGGGSSGANLAAAVALKAKETGELALRGQVLFYPALDATTSLPSYDENATGFMLTAAEMRYYWAAYHRGSVEPTEPLLSPLHAPDLSGLPPTIIHLGEFDVLRDEGEAYAARLAEAGVPTVCRRYEGQIHGFASLSHVTPDAGHSLAEVGAWLRALLAD